MRAALFLKRLAEVSSPLPVRTAFHQARMASMTPAPSDAGFVDLSSFMPDGEMICTDRAIECECNSAEHQAKKTGEGVGRT